MTPESKKNGTDQSSNGHDENEKTIARGNLYSEFEAPWLEENKKSYSSLEKSLWQKLYHLNGISPEFLMLSKHNTSSNNKTEPKPNLQNSEPSSSTKIEFFREISRPEGSSTVHGFENEVLSLERMLLRPGSNDDQNQFKAIGVVGMTGVGKTTLCQEIFNTKEVKNHFLPRIWVCMSRQKDDDQNPKIVIVNKLLASLGVEEEIINIIPKNHQQLRGLLYALRLQLIGKRYLIVLDDCDQDIQGLSDKQYFCLSNGSEKCIEHLSYGLPKGHGGTVIVTSRNEQLAKIMVGKKNLHKLLPLSDSESCWLIYRDSILGEGVEFNLKPPKEFKDGLTRKCGGLPLASKLMGQIKAEQLQVAAAQGAAKTNNATQ